MGRSKRGRLRCELGSKFEWTSLLRLSSRIDSGFVTLLQAHWNYLPTAPVHLQQNSSPTSPLRLCRARTLELRSTDFGGVEHRCDVAC